MTVISTILVTLVALEFFYIMYIETIQTTSETTRSVFHLTAQDLENEKIQTLLKNQGIYKGLIGVLLLYGTYFSHHALEINFLILGYIILVAAYGCLTSDKKIILTQGGLAILALLSLWFHL